MELVDSLMAEMDRRQLSGDTTEADVLDRPILRALKMEMAKQTDWLPKPSTTEDKLYDRFRLDPQ
jgi:hypothetical protein